MFKVTKLYQAPLSTPHASPMIELRHWLTYCVNTMTQSQFSLERELYLWPLVLRNPQLFK